MIDFLKEAFGATELRRYDMPDGSILHAEVRIDDTVMMAEAASQGAAIGAATGAGLGAISGAAAKGKTLKVPSETRLTFALRAPLSSG